MQMELHHGLRGTVMKQVLLGVLFTAAVAWPAGAQVGQPPPAAALPLTLDAAIRRGLESSPRLEEATARSDMAEAIADQRDAATRPQAAVQGGYTRTNHVEAFGVVRPNNELVIIYPDLPDNYRTRLEAQWAIYDGGRRHSLERAARRDAVGAAGDVDVARQELRLEITRVYWSLVTAIESHRVLDESLARMDAHLRDVRNQLDAGLIPPNDVLAVEARRSRQRMLGIQARVNREVVETELGRLVGAPPGTAIQPVATTEALPETVFDIESLIREARQNRGERGALAERVLAATEREKAAAASARPTVAASGGVDYANPNPRIFPRQDAWKHSWDASLHVSWPILDGGRTRAEIAEAAAATRAARARLAEFDAVLEVEVRQRVREVEASRAAIAAAEDGVRAATEARRVAGERFAAGVAISTDILDAQVALLQAGLDRTQAIANARLADVRLSRAIGGR
jgi:outer membrane protein TolC